jgi:hypothetical protein
MQDNSVAATSGQMIQPGLDAARQALGSAIAKGSGWDDGCEHAGRAFVCAALASGIARDVLIGELVRLGALLIPMGKASPGPFGSRTR